MNKEQFQVDFATMSKSWILQMRLQLLEVKFTIFLCYAEENREQFIKRSKSNSGSGI